MILIDDRVPKLFEHIHGLMESSDSVHVIEVCLYSGQSFSLVCGDWDAKYDAMAELRKKKPSLFSLDPVTVRSIKLDGVLLWGGYAKKHGFAWLKKRGESWLGSLYDRAQDSYMKSHNKRMPVHISKRSVWQDVTDESTCGGLRIMLTYAPDFVEKKTILEILKVRGDPTF